MFKTWRKEEDDDDLWDNMMPPEEPLILEKQALQQLVERNLKPCSKRGAERLFMLNTVTIALNAFIQCKNKDCNDVDKSSSIEGASQIASI